jgi:predicted AlkP superfamily phosphohydrolase/phosphomutase
MPTPDFRVLIVGLDGATFDLMLPWIEEGCLPNLARILRSGSKSPLESTIPPITPCAWSSFMTGKNPGKHGLFDFIEPHGEHGFRFTNASFRDGETLWGCLSRHGRRVGVVNVPMTFPPEPVNGFLISGLDTPHELSPFMYPVEIRSDLKQAGISATCAPTPAVERNWPTFANPSKRARRRCSIFRMSGRAIFG